MKLNFNFNIAGGAAQWGLALWLMIALAGALPAVSQQAQDQPPPQAPGAIQPVATAPSGDAADPASDPPPPDEGVETMFPHFRDTRYWLSGQMNFIFQTHPPFNALY